MVTSIAPRSTLTPKDIDEYYHTGIESIRSGTKNLESYYSAINGQQIAENKLLKEANQGLQSLIRPLFAENAALKQEAAGNKEKLDKLAKERSRWEEDRQNIARTCRTLEELTKLLSANNEKS
jgi:predicted nuclease with TOPRIM domain